MAALKTWTPWIPLNNEVTSHHLKQLLALSLPLLRDGNVHPGKISHAAAHLLLNMSNTAFPPTLIVLPSVIEFIHIAPNLRFSGTHTRDVLNNALCNILIRPWGELSHTDSSNRNALIGAFFDALTREFRELEIQTSEGKVREIVSTTLPSLSHIIEFAKDFPSQSKKLLYMGLKVTCGTGR